MSLEAKLDKLTEVMEALPAKIAAAIAAGGGKAAPAETPKAETKPAGKPKAEAKAKVPTAEEVKDAATAYAKRKDKAAAKALIAKFGAKDTASIAEDKRAAFIAACQAEDEEPEEEAEGEDDDL